MTPSFPRSYAHGIPVLEVSTPVTRNRQQDFALALEALVSDARTVAIVDMELCPFVTSQVFPMLLRAQTELASRGGGLVIAVGHQLLACFQVLKLTGDLTFCSHRGAGVELAHRLLLRQAEGLGAVTF